jgi:hypothetical protein
MNKLQRYAYEHALTGESTTVAARYCQQLPGGWSVCLSFNK